MQKHTTTTQNTTTRSDAARCNQSLKVLMRALGRKKRKCKRTYLGNRTKWKTCHMAHVGKGSSRCTRLLRSIIRERIHCRYFGHVQVRRSMGCGQRIAYLVIANCIQNTIDPEHRTGNMIQHVAFAVVDTRRKRK